MTSNRVPENAQGKCLIELIDEYWPEQSSNQSASLLSNTSKWLGDLFAPLKYNLNDIRHYLNTKGENLSAQNYRYILNLLMQRAIRKPHYKNATIELIWKFILNTRFPQLQQYFQAQFRRSVNSCLGEGMNEDEVRRLYAYLNNQQKVTEFQECVLQVNTDVQSATSHNGSMGSFFASNKLKRCFNVAKVTDDKILMLSMDEVCLIVYKYLVELRENSLVQDAINQFVAEKHTLLRPEAKQLIFDLMTSASTKLSDIHFHAINAIWVDLTLSQQASVYPLIMDNLENKLKMKLYYIWPLLNAGQQSDILTLLNIKIQLGDDSRYYSKIIADIFYQCDLSAVSVLSQDLIKKLMEQTIGTADSGDGAFRRAESKFKELRIALCIDDFNSYLDLYRYAVLSYLIPRISLDVSVGGPEELGMSLGPKCILFDTSILLTSTKNILLLMPKELRHAEIKRLNKADLCGTKLFLSKLLLVLPDQDDCDVILPLLINEKSDLPSLPQSILEAKQINCSQSILLDCCNKIIDIVYKADRRYGETVELLQTYLSIEKLASNLDRENKMFVTKDLELNISRPETWFIWGICRGLGDSNKHNTIIDTLIGFLTAEDTSSFPMVTRVGTLALRNMMPFMSTEQVMKLLIAQYDRDIKDRWDAQIYTYDFYLDLFNHLTLVYLKTNSTSYVSLLPLDVVNMVGDYVITANPRPA